MQEFKSEQIRVCSCLITYCNCSAYATTAIHLCNTKRQISSRADLCQAWDAFFGCLAPGEEFALKCIIGLWWLVELTIARSLAGRDVWVCDSGVRFVGKVEQCLQGGQS